MPGEHFGFTDTRAISSQLDNSLPAQSEGMTSAAYWMRYVGLLEEPIDDPLPYATLPNAHRRML
jgi:hypothetical protein